MLELTLVRHGSTPSNDERRYQGWVDTPLSSRGHLEAGAVAIRLRRSSWDQVWTSDLDRSMSTARRILDVGAAEPGSARPEVRCLADPRLREIGFGEWEGLTFEECEARDPAHLGEWIEAPHRVAPPGGEPFADFSARLAEVLAGLPTEGRVLVVTHGGPIRWIIASALSLSWEVARRLECAPASITRLAIEGGDAILRTLNDTAHLEGLARAASPARTPDPNGPPDG